MTAPYDMATVHSSLFTPKMRLTAVINALTEHYGKDGNESTKKTAFASLELDSLLQSVPRGIVYITHAAKEGVFSFSDLAGENTPKYVVKRFEKFEHVEHVHSLSKWLRTQGELHGKSYGVSYLQTPKTVWPLRLEDYSVLFMDAIDGEDLLSLMPRLRRRMEQGDQNAVVVRDNIISIALGNLAYYQHISQEAAADCEYAVNPKSISQFVEGSIKGGYKTLETMTNDALGDKEKIVLDLVAMDLGAMIRKKSVISLDTGPRNIMISRDVINQIDASGTNVAGENVRAPSLSTIATGAQHVDLPYEWRTVHELRDAVRLLYAPLMGLSFEKAQQKTAVLLLKRRYLATDLSAYLSENERSQASEQLRWLSQGESAHKLGIPDYEEHSADLFISVIAEAARMNSVIPRLFLSKIKAELDGALPTTETPEKLKARYRDLMQENGSWANNGRLAIDKLMPSVKSSATRDRLQHLIKYFEQWINLEKINYVNLHLPNYRPFMHV